MTEFRRAVRYHNAMWREANGYPIGTHRVRPGTPPRLIGSQLDLDFARESGATSSPRRRSRPPRARTSFVEPHQIFDHQSFWADLLSSEALAVNLFGDLAADPDRADRAVHSWWPATPGRVTEERFADSPGSSTRATRTASARSTRLHALAPGRMEGALAIDVKYREAVQPLSVKPNHIARFLEIHDRSRAFEPNSVKEGKSRLSLIWLEHILLLSMLQHESGRWTWGRYVVVHPDGNTDVAHATDEYRELLADNASLASATIEHLLAAKVLAPKTTAALRRRYLL